LHRGTTVAERPGDMASDATPPSLFQTALARLRRSGSTVGHAALASGAILQLPAMSACVADDVETASAEQADWAQYEGQRDTSMISYTGSHWSVCKQPNSRFGCGSIDIHVKLRVKPVAGADLAWKKVGIVFKAPGDVEKTAVGNYVQSLGDGYEEWEIVANVPQWQTTILFDAWYQDGAGHTYYDDNSGELHVVNEGPDYQIVRAEPWLNAITIGDDGVHGRISIQVTDLDWDKQLVLVASKDGWQTVIELGIGNAGETNKWYWVEDFPYGANRERWQIDLDLPGSADTFDYAVAYKHGVVNGAVTYTFWDNNYGQNYHYQRDVIE
jgi:hypothetical protein